MTECPTCEKVLNTEQGVRMHHTRVHDTPLPNRVCKGCETEFYDPRSDRVYCDDCNPNAGEHNPNWQDAKAEATCEICDESFVYYPWDKEGVYCPDCVEAADEFLGTPSYELREIERVKTTCRYCDNEFEILQSAYERGEGRFCNNDCQNAWMAEQWSNSHDKPYRGKWYRMRRAAYERDSRRCQYCGISRKELGRNPDVHHIIPIREFDNPEEAHFLDNLICLCPLCHRRAELDTITREELLNRQK